MQSSTAVIPREQRKCADDLKDRFAESLHRDYGHRRSHLKLIARAAEVSPKTVEAWKAGRYLPSLDAFFRLLPKSPSLQAMTRMAELESELSPEFARELNALIQRHLK